MNAILVLNISLLVALFGGIAVLWARLKGLSLAYQTLANQYQSLVAQQVEGWAKLQQQQDSNIRQAHHDLQQQMTQQIKILENRLAHQGNETREKLSQAIEIQGNRVIAIIQEPIL